MKKGLKALSAVLALSMGLVGASLVNAIHGDPSMVEPNLSFTINDLTEGAQDLLKVKEKTEAAVNKFYESVLVDLDGDLAAAEEAIDNLRKDANARANLNTIACNAAQAVQAIDNELRGMKRLMELAKTYVADTKAAVGTLTGDAAAALQGALDKVGAKASFGGDAAALKKLVKEFNAAEDKDAGIFTPAVAKDDVQKAVKAKFEKLTAKIAGAEYQEAAKRVAQYTEEKANARVFKLKAEKVKLTGVAKIAARVAAENGIKIEACALPTDLVIDEKPAAKEEAKKDSVPNTAAVKFTVVGAGDAAMFYFRPIVPCCHKKAAKAEKAVPFYTFEGLAKTELVPAPCCHKKAAKAEMKSAYTFGDFGGLNIPCDCE